MSDTKMLGVLALGLLALMMILGLTFVVGAQFQKTICVDVDGSYSNGGSCWTDTNYNVSSQSNAFNQTGKVIDSIELVTSFLTIIVLVLITKLLIKNVKSATGGAE